VAGLKTTEYRSWPTAYRGPLFIHAAARPADPCDMAAFPALFHSLDPARLTYGAVLGVVELADCRPHGGGWAWVLASPRPLAVPFRCRGALGLWTPPAAVRFREWT